MFKRLRCAKRFAFCTSPPLILFLLLLLLRNFRRRCFTYGMGASLMEWMLHLYSGRFTYGVDV